MQTFTTIALIATVASVAVATPANTTTSSFSGDATFYSPGDDACSKTGHSSTSTDLIAALNIVQFGGDYNGDTDQSPSCYKCALVHGPLGSVKVQIVDLCPECKSGDLDLSPAAFNTIAKAVDGRVKMTWDFVAC